MTTKLNDSHKNNQVLYPLQSIGGHGGNRWAAEARWGIAADKFIDFSASINPLGPSRFAMQAIQNNLSNLAYYPEPSGQGLIRVLAEYLVVDEENIVLGNGSAELIYLCARMYGHKRVLVLAPGFSEYGQGIAKPDIIRIDLDLNGLRLPLAQIAANLEAGDLLFINNPNNPTGNLFGRQELLELLAIVKAKQARLVLDESFIDFVRDRNVSLRDIAVQEPNLVVLGSLTKFFALPGLRIGYALTNRSNLQNMRQLLPPWRINTLALAAGTAALQDQEYIHHTQALIETERNYIANRLGQIAGLKVYPSQANFILIDASQRGIAASDLQNRLGSEGILIRDCRDFYNLSPYHFRLAVRNRRENEILLKTIRKVLN